MWEAIIFILWCVAAMAACWVLITIIQLFTGVIVLIINRKKIKDVFNIKE